MPAPLLIVLILFAVAGPALADPPESCMDEDVEGVTAHVNHLTTLLKIAVFRADIPAMTSTEEELGLADKLKAFLATCGEEASGRIGRVCGYDCHLQLGRYHLFMASDLPYLATASAQATSSQPASPDVLSQHAEAGAQVLERGLRLIGRQQAASTEGSRSLRNYYRQLTALSTLRARLITTGGDIWYQTVSDARVRRLNFLVDETLGDPGDAAAFDPNLARALAAYERAMWALIEAKTDIPSETTYGDLRTEVLGLERELITRLDSVNAGLLFLGIDPEEFLTHTFEELKAKMEELKVRLTGIEGRIEGVIENWINKRGTNAARQIDEGRVVRSQKANLAAHRIAKLETAAQTASAAIHDQVLAVQEKRDAYAYREGVRKLEIALERTIAELRYKQGV